MITNGFDLNRIGKAQSAALTWVRISGVKFFEGKTASDIDLGYVQPERVGFNFVCPIGTVTSRTPGSEVRLSALLELLDAILALSKYSFHPYRARFRSRDPGRSICR